jgi:hypothetical protein
VLHKGRQTERSLMNTWIVVLQIVLFGEGIGLSGIEVFEGMGGPLRGVGKAPHAGGVSGNKGKIAEDLRIAKNAPQAVGNVDKRPLVKPGRLGLGGHGPAGFEAAVDLLVKLSAEQPLRRPHRVRRIDHNQVVGFVGAL